LAGTLIAAAATLSACSVAQNYTYVTDSGDSAYFKVPPAWRPVDQHLLAAQVLAAHHGSDGSLPLPVPAPAAVELDAISAMNPRPSSTPAQTPRDQP
jgi:hypothetical protein